MIGFKYEDPSGFFLRTAKGFVYVSGLFCLVMAVLLVANYIQLSTADPLDNDVLATLRAVYSRDQNNEILIDQVRALDLLARKAYFTRRWQLRTGGLLLLGGFGVFVAEFYHSERMGSAPNRVFFIHVTLVA